MPIYGFESQDDFNRARDVIRTVEGKRVDLTRTKRARYPATGSGGGGLRPYIITQTGGENLAYVRPNSAFNCKPKQDAVDIIDTPDDIIVVGDFLSGAVFTGCHVMVQRGATNYAIAGSMGEQFFAAAVDAIAADDDGDVEIQYLDALDAQQFLTVIAHNYTARGIAAGTQVIASIVSFEWCIFEVLC